MAASAAYHHPDANPDITYLTPEPFEPKPLIADILRTRFCVPDSVFLVEGIDGFYTSKSQRWRAVRLLLGDGELCVQALLAADMHRFVDSREIVFGSYVQLQRFRIESRDVGGDAVKLNTGEVEDGAQAPEENDQIVTLIVDSLAVVGWHNSMIDPATIAVREEVGNNIQDTEEDKTQPQNIVSVPSTVLSRSAGEGSGQNVTEQVSIHQETELLQNVAHVEENVEIPSDPQVCADNRRSASPATAPNTDPTPGSRSQQPWFIKDPSKPLKLTKLRAIPNLPYKQNWSVNLLCIVSAISDVEPAGLPPYTQRQARLTDPSTDKHVLLTVFLDAHLFEPAVGSIVLLLGVKNHRFDGGSVKKYASDQPRDGESWWYQNPVQFPWLSVEVDELRRWWTEMGIVSFVGA